MSRCQTKRWSARDLDRCSPAPGARGERVPQEVEGVSVVVVEVTLTLAGKDPSKKLQRRVVVAGQRHQAKPGAAGQAAFDGGFSGGPAQISAPWTSWERSRANP